MSLYHTLLQIAKLTAKGCRIFWLIGWLVLFGSSNGLTGCSGTGELASEEDPSGSIFADTDPALLPGDASAEDRLWCTGEKVNQVLEGRDGRIYATTGNGLSVSLDSGRTFTNATVGNGLPSQGITAFFLAANNDIYTGHNASNGCRGSGCGLPELKMAISRNRGNDFTAKSIWRQQSFDSVAAITKVAETIVLMVDGPLGGLYLSNDDGETFEERTSANDRFPTNSLRGLMVFDDSLYIASSRGLIKTQVADDSYQLMSNLDLPYASIENVYVDADVIVVGSYYGGSYSFDGGASFRAFTADIASNAHVPPSDETSVTASCRDTQGRLYLGLPYRLVATDDLGASYQEVTLPILANVIAINCQGAALYLATTKGLMVSYDRGQNFASFNHNHGLGAWQIESVDGRDQLSVDEAPGSFPE